MAFTSNMAGVYDLLFGKTNDNARIAVIGDSQTSSSIGRMYHGMLQWPFDWSAVAVPARMASFAMGPLNLGVPAASTFTSKDVDALPLSGITGTPTAVSEYSMIKNLADGERFGAQRFFVEATDWSTSWSRFSAATNLHYRGVYQDGPGIGNYVGDTANLQMSGAAAGTPAPLSGGGAGILGFSVFGPKAATPAVVDINFFGGTTDENTLVFSHYGGMVGEDDGAAGFVRTPKRPWSMSVVWDGGGGWDEYADETSTNFRWNAYGDYLFQLCDIGSPPHFGPNIFFVVLGHNGGGFPDTATTRAEIGRFVTALRAEYTAKNWEQPFIVCVHAWQVSTVTESVWRSVWEESFLPNSGDKTCCISIAAYHNFIFHTSQLPDGIHPNDKAKADFFFGETGLLGAIRGSELDRSRRTNHLRGRTPVSRGKHVFN